MSAPGFSRLRFRPLVFFALVLLAASCGGGAGETPTAPLAESGGGDSGGGSSGGSGDGSSGGSEGGSTGTGRLQLEMTDAPVDDVTQLVVWVSGLKVKLSGQPTAHIDARLGAYDLLQLQGGASEVLADAQVAAGTYQYIEILLDESRSFVVERATGRQAPLDIASDKAKLNGPPFDVLENGTTVVLFDFDAERSLTQRGNGTWLLHPVLEIVEVQVAAST